MKTSDLIKRLEIIQTTFGDLDASVWDGDNCTLFDVFDVSYLPSKDLVVINKDELCE